MDSIKAWLDPKQGRTQAALASSQKVSPPTVNEWVHGHSSPSSQRLHGIHKHTGIPLAVLIEDCAKDAARRKKASAA